MIRFRKLAASLLLMLAAAPALADIKLAIGEPGANTTRSGIGLISGWAISHEGVDSVEALINGESLGMLPYGSARGDVAAAFPDYADSLHSGWAMKWNYSLLAEGEHLLTIVVTDNDGGTLEKDVWFKVTGFESEFIADPEKVLTEGVTIESPEDGRFVVTGAVIESKVVNFELVWDTGSQQFLIDYIEYTGEEKNLKPPTVQAGADKSVNTGEAVTIEGSASDPDGQVTSMKWSQVSGPSVSLTDTDKSMVKFTAPASAGTLRLRLTVTDNDGLKASDDVMVMVSEPEPEPNQAPQANAGPDFSVDAQARVVVQGQGNDSDGEIVSWEWYRYSGLQVSLQNADSPTVSFTAPSDGGIIRLRLKVTDNEGATDLDEVVITVNEPEPPPNQAPTANAGSNKTVQVNESVSLTGSGSDPDGEIASWSWSQVSGTSVSLTGANSAQVQFTAPGSATEIRLRLTVTDNGGATDSDDVIITVEAEAGPDNTTGYTLESMLPFINEARGEARTCGNDSYPAQPPLQWSNSLADIARQHSMEMAREGFFTHESHDGSSMGTRVWPYWNGTTIGENIAASSVNRSDEYVVQLWLDSPGHCALIMHPGFTHAGAASGHNTENGYKFHHFWTLDFGG